MVGNGEEGDDKYRINGAGAEYSVQGIRAVGVVIWEQKLGGDGGYAKSTRGIS